MEIALWIVAGIVAAANIFSGSLKVFTLSKYLETAAWATNVSPALVRTVGALEVLGGIGIILPQATGILPVVTIIAAVCLALTQLVAGILHIVRKEYSTLPVNAVLLALPLFVAIGRLYWS